jgi:hypothetical protein
LKRSLRQLLNLGFENLEVSFWVERFSCGALDEFGGGIATTVGVDFLTKPAKEGLIVAIFNRSGEGRNIPIRGLPKLGGGQIAQSVCRKVAEAAKGPVDVLEATACIAGNF